MVLLKVPPNLLVAEIFCLKVRAPKIQKSPFLSIYIIKDYFYKVSGPLKYCVECFLEAEN